MEDGRALFVDRLGVGPRSDESVEVARLELMGVPGKGPEVPDAEVAGPGGENVAKGQGAERRVTPGAPAVDQQSVGVRPAGRGEVARRVHAVVEVHDSPGALQSLAVRAAVAGAAAVVDVGDGEPPTGPVLDRVVESGVALCRRPTVTGDNERRQRSLGGGERRGGGGGGERGGAGAALALG